MCPQCTGVHLNLVDILDGLVAVGPACNTNECPCVCASFVATCETRVYVDNPYHRTNFDHKSEASLRYRALPGPMWKYVSRS